MNSQDITRALIDTTVARAMVEMDADPKRSVRKLCDLGRQFSRGRFQNQIFAIFQDLLRNDESPYYQAIDFLLRSNDPEALRQFGINIGYNSFTYGAQILRQKQKELSLISPRRMFSINSSPNTVLGASKRYLSPLLSTERVKEPCPFWLLAKIPLLWSWFKSAKTSLLAKTPSSAPR